LGLKVRSGYGFKKKKGKPDPNLNKKEEIEAYRERFPKKRPFLVLVADVGPTRKVWGESREITGEISQNDKERETA